MSPFAAYEGLVCDLDGVVYRGPHAVPYAVESLVACGKPIVFATNNASRTPGDVADHLTSLGLTCRAEDVVTSSQAAAWVLMDRIERGSPVLAIGGPGVAAALSERGFALVDSADDDPVAVVQGYGSQVSASDLAEAAYAVHKGALWVATNTDATLPTDRGVAPGNGSLVAAVATATGREPDVVAGKPHAPCYLLAAERLGCDPGQLLAVGDRLDTDIAGAVAASMDSLLVLTGVSTLKEARCAPDRQGPTFVADDLRALVEGRLRESP